MPTSCNKHTQTQTAVNQVLVRELGRAVFSETHKACATRANYVQHTLAYSETMYSKSTANEKLARGFVDRSVVLYTHRDWTEVMPPA